MAAAEASKAAHKAAIKATAKPHNATAKPHKKHTAPAETDADGAPVEPRSAAEGAASSGEPLEGAGAQQASDVPLAAASTAARAALRGAGSQQVLAAT